MDYQLKKLIARTDRLPTRNPVAFEVIQLASDPESSLQRLKDAISADQSLTSQILRIANSSYFNYPRTIHSIERAIIILGFNLVRDIAVSIAIYSFYKGFPKTTLLDLRYQWRHALSTAIVARTLAQKYDPSRESLFYLAGLLHDIGKLVECLTMRDDFDFLIEKSRQEGLRLDQVEKRFLNFHHGDMGAELLQEWRLPEHVVEMVRSHHEPVVTENEELRFFTRMIYLSNLLAHFVVDPLPSMEALVQYDVNFTRHFQFTSEEFQELVDSVKVALDENQMFFQLLHV